MLADSVSLYQNQKTLKGYKIGLICNQAAAGKEAPFASTFFQFVDVEFIEHLTSDSVGGGGRVAGWVAEWWGA